MADGKWIPEVTAATPVVDAARWVLSLRLEVVRNHLPLALREPGKDIEHVHQLRVGTRRAGAAVEIFARCLSDSAYKAIRHSLRRIRRAAGAARDWDVFLAGLTEEKQAETASNQPGLDLLIGYGLAQRILAQTHLEAVCSDSPFDFDRLRVETIAAIRPPRSKGRNRTLLDLALPMLTERVHELDEATARDLEDYDNLHQVRIAGKRLRYAMEVFANCFAPAFRKELYPLVEEMQRILGNANDSHVASQRLTLLGDQLRANRLLDRSAYEPGIRKLLRVHEQRLPEERRQFQEWWKRWQQLGGKAAFAALLTPASSAQASKTQRGKPAPGPTGNEGPAPGGNGADTEGIMGIGAPIGAGTPKSGPGATGDPTPP